MKFFNKTIPPTLFLSLVMTLSYAAEDGADFDQYPSTVISNEHVKVKVYLPDPEKGLYRATRFDWSGAIGSLQYKGHEYFGYWRNTHDPMDPVGIMGPADTYKTAGLGYDEAKVGEGFLRIGVGAVEKADEPEYDYHNDYKILDHGKWAIDQGENWIRFTHEVESELGYGYSYIKTIRLTDDGVDTEHRLKNTGTKPIETDQYSHNFFMVDKVRWSPSIELRYPYPVVTKSDLKGFMEVKGNTLTFTKEAGQGHVFMALEGYGKKAADNQFTILNTDTGAGVTVSVDRPLSKLEFWTNGFVVCPEHTIQLAVQPGEETVWNSDYSLFVE